MMIRDQVTMAEPDVLFEDGKEVDVPGWDLRTVWTPGHSPGHVCFHSERHRLLLSGDHVLPRITPNIGVHTQQIPNPLGDFLESLLKVQNLAVDEVLPAHEYRFANLRDRLDEIILHHADRLADIERLLAREAGNDRVADGGEPDVVPPVGRDPRIHATGGRRRDVGSRGAPRDPSTLIQRRGASGPLLRRGRPCSRLTSAAPHSAAPHSAAPDSAAPEPAGRQFSPFEALVDGAGDRPAACANRALFSRFSLRLRNTMKTATATTITPRITRDQLPAAFSMVE